MRTKGVRRLLPTLVRIGLDLLVLGYLTHDMVFSLEDISFHEKALNKMQLQGQSFTTCELIWLKQLIKELKFCEVGTMRSICESRAALLSASKPFFHKQTKHIEIGCHFICKKIVSQMIKLDALNSIAECFICSSISKCLSKLLQF